MNRPKNFRAYFLFAALAISGLVVLLREHRPSFLHPDLHLCAYVTTADGNVTVVDLVKLKAVARIAVGPGLSGMREHPTRPEVFGVSSTGGYVWILDPSANHFTGQVTSRIAVGPLPYALDFSPDGNRIYTTASGNNTLLAIDVRSRAIIARAATGLEPVLAHVTPDGKTVVVVNRRDGTLGMHDAVTLAQRGSVSVVGQPEDVAVLPDSSLAFVLSRSERRISVVDLRRGASLLYVSDTAADRVTPVDIFNRRIVREPGKGFPIPAGDAPAALRFDPAENLLLVVSEGSGDLAVIRVRTNFLLTMIPVGSHPQGLAVKLF